MPKDFDRWNDAKKRINDASFVDFANERDVWWASLGVNVGSEQDGTSDIFERPVLIVRKFNKDTVLIVPLTSSPRRTPYHIAVRHDGAEFAAIISQLRLISTKRLRRKIYQMDRALFSHISECIRLLFPARQIETPAQGGGFSEGACP
jgi:mRNA-degrading endonuclease toxin of MazEF toxin-antitoxin module